MSIQAWSAGTGVPIAQVREELARLQAAHPALELSAKTKAGTIMLNPAAWPLLWRGLGLDEILPLPGGLPPKNEAAGTVQLTVLTICINRRILEALDENKQRVRVRVRDNTRWKPKDRIEARQAGPDTPDLYDIVSRPPRRWGDPL